MKKLLLLFSLALLLLISCATPMPVNVSKSYPLINNSNKANIGDVFFFLEEMNGKDNGFGSVFEGNAYRIDLTIISASSNKVSLEYNEYMKPGAYGGYIKDGSWLVKNKFTKRFEYELSEDNKIINYKSFQFEISRIENGSIEYKRIK